jgi:lipid-A-disaccharide synthase-like uncharacterized protein
LRSTVAWIALALVLSLVGLVAAPLVGGGGLAPVAEPAFVKVKLADSAEKVQIERLPDGSHRFVLHRNDGREEHLSPEAFAALVVEEEAGRAWWLHFLNISSVTGLLWVSLGLAGQLIFTGRMLLQWLASERERRSVVPVSFWWLSLAGSSMLVAYFLWRRDAVGVLGQGSGWVIYLRNLWLIYRGEAVASV